MPLDWTRTSSHGRILRAGRYRQSGQRIQRRSDESGASASAINQRGKIDSIGKSGAKRDTRISRIDSDGEKARKERERLLILRKKVYDDWKNKELEDERQRNHDQRKAGCKHENNSPHEDLSKRLENGAPSSFEDAMVRKALEGRPPKPDKRDAKQGPLESVLGKRSSLVDPTVSISPNPHPWKRRRLNLVVESEPKLRRTKMARTLHFRASSEENCFSSRNRIVGMGSDETRAAGVVSSSEVQLLPAERSEIADLVDECFVERLTRTVTRLQNRKELHKWKRTARYTRLAGDRAVVDQETGLCSSPLCCWCRPCPPHELPDDAKEAQLQFKIELFKSLAADFSDK